MRAKLLVMFVGAVLATSEAVWAQGGAPQTRGAVPAEAAKEPAPPPAKEPAPPPKGQTFEAQPLDFTLAPPPDAKLQPLGQNVLQRRDGTYVVLLWQQVSVFDAAAKTKIENPPIKHTFLMTEPFDVTLYVPNDSTTPIKQHRATKSFEFEVTDRVLVITLAQNRVARGLEGWSDA